MGQPFQYHSDYQCVLQSNTICPVNILFTKCPLSFANYIHIKRYNLLRIILITMMTSSNGNIFRVTGPLWGEFILTVEQTTVRLVIWDAIALIMTSLLSQCVLQYNTICPVNILFVKGHVAWRPLLGSLSWYLFIHRDRMSCIDLTLRWAPG